ncbi:acylamino-acid-releasing enzyme-like isoform X2 [Actinia tenebrosa]|uniref:acylaminoacyl-peptidase n=1 Tax=Actinia tenebrosa TaxID=6105 RepID=A0A6P8II03_ACTTE|nr:acylamino-acid-releasing enzyme-like isoform X2 [Actinia tenebrosa]
MAETEQAIPDQGFIDHATQIYKELSSIPTITGGSLYTKKNGKDNEAFEFVVTSKWSQRDLEKKEKRVFQRNHIATFSGDSRKLISVQEPSFPVELQNVQLSSTSPSGKYQAIIRKIPATKKDDEKQFIEIWSCNNIIKSIDIKAADKHGDINEDSQFGSLQWSPSEKYLLYVAEKKKPKKVSYFDSSKSESSEKSKPETGFQFDYESDWGELLVKKSHPILTVLDIHKGDISVIDGIPDDLSVGQAIWNPGETGVVFSGWKHEPYRLGLIYCTNRRSGIFHISLDGTNFEQLSLPDNAVLSPRFNPQMDKLIYLARNTKGVHACCLKLMEFDWKARTTVTIVDIVDYPRDDGFAGIYCSGLPERCWSFDGKRIILGSFWASSLKILAIDVESKSVMNLTKEDGCWNVLDVQKDLILASFSSPSCPNRLLIRPLTSSGDGADLDWTVIANMEDHQDIKWENITLSPDGDKTKSYEAVLIQPTNLEKDVQLVVHPHGGPHSNYPSNYMIEFAGLCKLGFAVLSVNYRGSLGFGQKVLESLLGNVGTQDVGEVKYALDKVLETRKFDKKNVFVMGGSHGGFIACHFIGQYPDFFSAVAIRNPVINIVSLIGTSDIPDWGFEEAACDFDDDLLADAETYAKLLSHSPISHVKKIVTPTMLMLGEVDLRVPPSQGKELYRTLKARGVDVRLLIYPDNSHPLNKVEAESDAFVNISRWFNKHRN